MPSEQHLKAQQSPTLQEPKLLKGRVNLTQGPILPALLLLAWPVVVANALQTVYNLADTYWVGRLGAEGVAAVSLSFPILFLFISLGGGLSVAGTTLVAQYVGAGRDDRANYIAAQTFGFVGVLAIGLSALGYLLSGRIIQLLGPEQAVIVSATAYLKIWFLGLPFVFGFFVFQALVKGSGDTINPMKIMLASTVLNIILDPFFIFGWSIFPEMGVAGAAVATVISRGLATVVGMFMLLKGHLGLRIYLKDMVPNLKTVRRILTLGSPAAVEQSMRALGMTAMTATAAAFGTPVLAAYGIGNRIVGVVFQTSMGFGQATTAMVGQNLGARLEDRAKQTTRVSAILVFSIMTALGVIAFFGARTIAGVFLTAADILALNHATTYIQVQALAFGFVGVMTVINGSFRGAGRTTTAMIFSMISMLALRVPLSYLLSRFTPLGPTGIWWGVALSNVIGASLVMLWFRYSKWQQRVIEDKPQPNASADVEQGCTL